jgi:DNA-binding ferritin-like protein
VAGRQSGPGLRGDARDQVKAAALEQQGPNFVALHEIIDSFGTELDEHVDTMRKLS